MKNLIKVVILVLSFAVPASAIAGGYGASAGTILGGAIGSKMGKGGGRTGAIFAGAVIGGLIGSAVEDANNAANGTAEGAAASNPDAAAAENIGQEVVNRIAACRQARAYERANSQGMAGDFACPCDDPRERHNYSVPRQYIVKGAHYACDNAGGGSNVVWR